ncbi:MAG: 4Fe-4S binding protein [Bacteroidota bacterium]|nr:4Fe-4S binding protein [Bacteroidota bacterium]MDP4234922.1 4Fe-4S binding protein [Bacteroidota bacterium]
MKSKFRSGVVSARYWVNGLIIATLIALPLFHVIKFDFLNGVFYLFGNETTWLVTATGFLGFWAGSYVLTLLADYVYGRLFCGWICSWGSLLRTLSYTRDAAKRKHLFVQAPQVFTVLAALVSTIGLLNWFTDITVLFQPSHKAFAVYLSAFLAITGVSTFMLWKVGLKFCQNYCPIGWYLGVISQKHMMRIDFEPANCTLGEVCVHDCPMALDPRLLAMDTEKDSHSQCILCGDCLTSCNACAAKVPGEKPLQLVTSSQPTVTIDLAGILTQMRQEKTEKRKLKKESKTRSLSEV